jgi:hypothetical protein
MHTSLNRTRTLTVILAVGGGLALILFTHGARWWYAPLAAVGVVLAHLAILSGIVFAAGRVTRGRRATVAPPAATRASVIRTKARASCSTIRGSSS